MHSAPRRIFSIVVLLSLPLILMAQAAPRSPDKPKVRAITAFVRLDRSQYRQQIADVLAALRKGKTRYEQAGYEVQTLRITTQPFSEYVRGLSREEMLSFFRDYDALAKQEKFLPSIGPAMLSDGDDPRNAELLGAILLGTNLLEGSIIVAGEDGIHWKAVREAARLMKLLEERSPHSQRNFDFAATAMLPANGPFFPGSYHRGAGHQFAVGLQSANVVAQALSRDPAAARNALASALAEQARSVEAIALRIQQETGWAYAALDVSPAPLKEVSIGAAIENFTGTKIGSSGTLTAAAIITSVLRELPVKHAGYSGLMLPVMEDTVLAQRWSEGALTMDSISQEQLERIIGDMASLAIIWHKPLSARLLPVAGKKAGERTEFDDPFLVNAVIQPLR